MADTPTFDDLARDLAGDSDVNEETVETQETTPPAPSADDTKAPEVAEPDAAAEDETEPESSDDEDSDVEEPAEEEKPLGEKGQQRIRDLVAERNDLVTQRRELMAEVERLNAQVYSPQSVDDIMQETGQDEAMARITAMEQRQELADYNTRVAESQLIISSESERVLQDFPMFNPDSAEYAPAVAEQAAQLLRQNLQVDPNTGQITGSNISPYQLYKTIASANQASAVDNQVKGQRAAQQQLASVDAQSSAVPKQPKEDPFLAGLMRGVDTPGS